MKALFIYQWFSQITFTPPCSRHDQCSRSNTHAASYPLYIHTTWLPYTLRNHVYYYPATILLGYHACVLVTTNHRPLWKLLFHKCYTTCHCPTSEYCVTRLVFVINNTLWQLCPVLLMCVTQDKLLYYKKGLGQHFKTWNLDHKTTSLFPFHQIYVHCIFKPLVKLTS